MRLSIWRPIALWRELLNLSPRLRQDNLEEWVRNFYGGDFDKDAGTALYSIIAIHATMENSRGIHQCEQCGRLWLQKATYENVWHAYLPESADWRGALEVPGEGFVGFVARQGFYGMRIEAVEREADMARVILVGEEGKRTDVTFSGVADVQMFEGAMEKRVRFLSEWKAKPPLRRFVFDSTRQSRELLLEVTALEVAFADCA